MDIILKRGTRPKTARNNKIMEYVKKGYSFESIGKIFHISKARVQQIVKRELERKNDIMSGEVVK